MYFSSIYFFLVDLFTPTVYAAASWLLRRFYLLDLGGEGGLWALLVELSNR